MVASKFYYRMDSMQQTPDETPHAPISVAPKSRTVAFIRKFLFIVFFIMMGLVVLGALGSMVNLVMERIERPKTSLNEDGK